MLGGTSIASFGRKRRGSAYPRRYRGGRRRYSGRRTYPLRRMPAAKFAAQVLAVVKPESKFHFRDVADITAQGDPMVTALSVIDQGTTAQLRIGNWIQPTTLYGHITVTGDTESVIDHSSVKLCLLQWNEDEDKNPFDGSELLQDNDAPGGPWRVSEKGTFTIMWSAYLIVINDVNNSQFSKTLKFNVDMKKRPRVLFEGPNRKKNHLFFAALTNHGALNAPRIELQSQLRYTDS